MKTISNYYDAVHFLGNSLILCNDVVNVDSSVFEEVRFELYDEETNEQKDIYQWFLTDCSLSDVEYLENRFGLLFTYSNTLDLYILCVDHFGTMWKGVHITDNYKE